MAFNFIGETVKTDNLYLGYEQWLPSPPKVQKPRSVFNAASLAYLGDCIYEVCFFSIISFARVVCVLLVLFWIKQLQILIQFYVFEVCVFQVVS